MAQRLIAGTPEKHDLTLVYRELLEKDNYAQEVEEYYAQAKKYKKE